MSNPLQDALSDAMEALEGDSGVRFTFASVAFIAWPTEQPREEIGRLTASPDQLHWYESRTASAFTQGQSVIGEDGKAYTVSKKNKTDPFTGAYKFAILPGRST